MTDATMNDNVVMLNGRKAAGAADCFEELETYWQALCRGRLLPARGDVDPRGIAGALDRVFLIERIAPGEARFRLAGQHVSALTGTDARGLPVTSLVNPAARDALGEALSALFDEPARVDLQLEGARSVLRAGVRARMLLLPLRDSRGEVTRAIGCLSAGSARTTAPQKFNITGHAYRTLIGYGAAPDPEEAPSELLSLADRLRQEIRERKLASKPELRLVKSDS